MRFRPWRARGMSLAVPIVSFMTEVMSVRKQFLIAPLAIMLLVAGAVGAAWPATAEAQRFGFGVGFRGPIRHSSTTVFVGRFGYLPYDPWYEFGYGYPAPYYAPYYYDPYRYEASSLRIEVKPKQAEVFVDGYRAGVVDDFDGVFQRLYLPP